MICLMQPFTLGVEESVECVLGMRPSTCSSTSTSHVPRLCMLCSVSNSVCVLLCTLRAPLYGPLEKWYLWKADERFVFNTSKSAMMKSRMGGYNCIDGGSCTFGTEVCFVCTPLFERGQKYRRVGWRCQRILVVISGSSWPRFHSL